MTTTRSPDPPPLGRLLTRREALGLIGVSSAVLFTRTGPAWGQTSGTLPSCVARPQQTEGPFFVDEGLDRSDIRSDPKSGELKPGVPLRLAFRVSRLTGTSCAPLARAQVDVWHCDAEGRYSDVGGFGFRAPTAGTRFLRGYQRTDATGAAQFLTICPGWYGGRAVHVHFKIRTADAAGRRYAFTSQLYFDDAFSERVFAVEPYASRGGRWLRNADDGIFREGGTELLLAPTSEGKGYAATFDIALQV